MKNYNVGLLGAVINNENMGCIALTYSLLYLLENISHNQDCIFSYYIFEDLSSESKLQIAAEKLSINFYRLKSQPIVYLFSYKRVCCHPIKSIKVIRSMYECDFFIDLTAGDSFTDIYGQERFDEYTNIKELIKKKMKKPLILGPQTYGPFNKRKNRVRACKVIEMVDCVIARDQASADYIQKCFGKKNIFVTTDMAFGLPYIHQHSQTEKIKVGINISSLLVKAKTEDTEIDFVLKTNYDLYTKMIICYLIAREQYEVHVIPHVGRDAGNELKKEFPKLIYVDEFRDPISAKNYISQMDIFIGARMHATIAAFSTGVATIPLAYSRKFSGLYETLDYPYIIDLISTETNKAIETTIEYIRDYKKLKESVKMGIKKAMKKNEETHRIMNEYIYQILFDL